MNDVIIKMENLTFGFERGINLAVRERSIYCFLGPNGGLIEVAYKKVKG